MFETICVLLKWSLSDNLLLLEAKQNERELSYLFCNNLFCTSI